MVCPQATWLYDSFMVSRHAGLMKDKVQVTSTSPSTYTSPSIHL